MTARTDAPSYGHPESARERRLSPLIYLVRVTFSLMTVLLLAVNDAYCQSQAASHPLLWLVGLLYPHLGQLLVGRRDAGLRYGRALLLIDGLYAGAVIGALEFTWLPSLVLFVICLFNWMIVGGPALIGLGLALLFAGALLTGDLASFTAVGVPEVCNAALWPSAALFAIYFLIVAQVIHRLIIDLQRQQAALQAETDAAIAARSQAERALLAAFPRSVANQLEATGTYRPETLQNAALMLIELSAFPAAPADLMPLQTAWQTCETILTRHGIELIKTCGAHAIALARDASKPEALFSACREILVHFSDHASLSDAGAAIPLRIVIHRAAVTLGLVQSARLNLDLCGPGIEELRGLAWRTASLAPRGLVASPAAYSWLSSIGHFSPLPPPPAATICYCERNISLQ